jgi:sugar O-acyltransferase (sialic acid O-acetyltransferase NeuD family)
MKKTIYIYGAGGLGREIKAMLLSMPEWELAGFYDDGLPSGTACENIPCLGGIDKLQSVSIDTNLVIAIGDPAIKLSIVNRLTNNFSLHFPVLVHRSAQLLDDASIQLGEGCIITAGCILTTNIKISKHTLINLNTTIGHDTVIGEASSIMPGVNISGQVTIGKGVLIGSGTNILNGLTVGDYAIVGAGAVVTKNVKVSITVVGVPAKELIQK